MKQAIDILKHVMSFKRMSMGHQSCSNECHHCMKPHLEKITRAIKNDEPVVFVLPAFPGKSPNLAKVLSPLPDMAEQLSLEFLEDLCLRIKQFHPPGARILLCSDGRVFSDAVGLKEDDVTEYQKEISRMIEELSLHSISTFNLDDVYKGLSFDEMRLSLMEKYGKSIDVLKELVKEDEDIHRLYCGMTRFLFEDAMTPGQSRSRASIQKESRARAYQVIQRSNAWSEIIEDLFPDAIRLSIHPQSCGSKKLGIRLLEANNWMTPWHGVAVKEEGRFHLLKRSEAEARGARLEHVDGKASHYVL